nr:MAG TPA: DNA-directed RNA polymerase [Caudoviricetes sp.]
MKKLVKMRCPSCNGQLNFSTDKDFCFCPFCGEKVLIDDGTQTTINITRDEAEIEKQKVRLEEIRLKHELDDQHQMDMQVRYIGIISCIIIIVSIVAMIIK